MALSGSLRLASYNTAVIQALAEIAPSAVDVQVFNQLGKLPLFNPDLEDQPCPVLCDLSQAIRECDALVIASPEYAHGISSVLKNALDWLVSGVEFVGKPVAIINTSPRAHHADDALREVITTMSGQLITDACISVPLLGSHLDTDDIVANEHLSTDLRGTLCSIQRFIKNKIESDGADLPKEIPEELSEEIPEEIPIQSEIA